MSKLLILAAMAAVSLACHNRAEDEVGAAPEQTDTTVTHVIDSTRTGPPGVGGRPGNATVTPDSVGVDSAVTDPYGTDTAATDTTWTSTPQDTVGTLDTGVEDTSAMQHDSTMMHGDSAMTGHPVPDTTSSQ